jgi:RING finger protein 121
MEKFNSTSNATIVDIEKILQNELIKEKETDLFFNVLFLLLMVSQLLLLWWKRTYFRSYQWFTLLGLWLIPLIIAAFSASQNIRFISTWILFSVGNIWIYRKATQRPLSSNIPKLVYGWFKKTYQICYALGIFGYTIIIIESFFLTPNVKDESFLLKVGTFCLLYGLYFGVLGRDICDILADTMASSIGYYNNSGFPNKHLRSNICAICGDALQVNVGFRSDSSIDVVSLDCRHSFHQDCIKGWCLIGKKDMCPYCKEKVDLKMFQERPWDTQQVLYLQLLDFLRYIIILWQPIILLAAYFFGVHRKEHFKV